MIMQCPDYDDSDYEFAPAPFGVEGLQSSPPDLPGFLYRGVPQDHRCRTLRIDTVGAQATGVNVTIPGPRWLTALHVSREFTESELFFG